jgi:DNA-binding transcriptional LysR family regulator
MELRHLRYFIAVAEELHFRRAAERLHMSQPPLSQQIRQLEEEIGAQLLTRSQRKVELTAAGAAFLVRSREILDAVEDAARQARRVQRGEVGRLAVGFVGSAMYSFVPELLRAFREQAPDIALRLHEMGTTEQLRQLDDGRLDVGFLRTPGRWPGLSFETVLSEQIVVAMPDVHPLAQRARLRMEDLAGESLVLLTPGGSPGLRAALATSIAQLGGEERIIQEASEMQTVVGLVAAGIGISLVPESVRALVREGVSYRPLDGESPVVKLAVAWRTADESPVLKAFLEQARAAAPAEGERGRRGPARN